MFCSDDTTVSTLTQFLHKLVFRVDDEGGVQSLESVTLHTEKMSGVRGGGYESSKENFMCCYMLIDGQIC